MLMTPKQKEKEESVDDEWGHHDVVEEEEEEKYDADECRQMGNHYFQNGDYDYALRMYTMALEAARVEKLDDSTLVTYLCNRAACLYRMEDYESSRDDAQEAVKLSQGAYIHTYIHTYIFKSYSNDIINQS